MQVVKKVVILTHLCLKNIFFKKKIYYYTKENNLLVIPCRTELRTVVIKKHFWALCIGIGPNMQEILVPWERSKNRCLTGLFHENKQTNHLNCWRLQNGSESSISIALTTLNRHIAGSMHTCMHPSNTSKSMPRSHFHQKSHCPSFSIRPNLPFVRTSSEPELRVISSDLARWCC